MPYVDLLSADDYASIWYTTNSPFGNVGSFDPEKPTIVMLHPMFLDSTWLDSQFGDPRLDSGFNLIAFDMRVCGRSSCRPSGLHDSWVEAADLAFACQVSCMHTSFSCSNQSPAVLRLCTSHLLISWPSKVCQQIVRSGLLYCAYPSPHYSIMLMRRSRFPEMSLSLTLCNVPPPTE